MLSGQQYGYFIGARLENSKFHFDAIFIWLQFLYHRFYKIGSLTDLYYNTAVIGQTVWPAISAEKLQHKCTVNITSTPLDCTDHEKNIQFLESYEAINIFIFPF